MTSLQFEDEVLCEIGHQNFNLRYAKQKGLFHVIMDKPWKEFCCYTKLEERKNTKNGKNVAVM